MLTKLLLCIASQFSDAQGAAIEAEAWRANVATYFAVSEADLDGQGCNATVRPGEDAHAAIAALAPLGAQIIQDGRPHVSQGHETVIPHSVCVNPHIAAIDAELFLSVALDAGFKVVSEGCEGYLIRGDATKVHVPAYWTRHDRSLLMFTGRMTVAKAKRLLARKLTWAKDYRPGGWLITVQHRDCVPTLTVGSWRPGTVVHEAPGYVAGHAADANGCAYDYIAVQDDARDLAASMLVVK